MTLAGEPPPFAVQLDRAALVRYAGASGDFNPIHWDPDYAQSAGFPGVFAHGMLTAGILAGYLTRWIGADAVLSYRVRFSGIVFPGQTLTCTGRVTRTYEQDGQSLVDCELEASTGPGEVKARATATCLASGYQPR